MAEKTFIEKIYNLRQNPFANWVDPTVEMAGRRKEKQQWEDFVKRRKGASTNAMCFIHGDYGFGKTLTLYKIVEQYNKDPQILPIFLKMLSEDRTPKFGVDFIHRVFQRIPEKVFKSFKLEHINLLAKDFPEPAKIFQYIALGGEGPAFDFLSGQGTISPKEMRRFGIKHKINGTDIAKKYLLCFLYLLGTTKTKSLLLAIDETEYVFSQMSGTGIAQVFNTLRDFFDLQNSPGVPSVLGFPSKPANMILFFAISTGGWRQIADLSRRNQAKPNPVQALIRRLENIELQPLSKAETKDLIAKRLRRDRVTGDYTSEPLIPYDESFVTYISEKSLGNPSEIIKFCDFALEDGLTEKVKILDAAFARKVFADRGLVFDEDST